MTIAGVEITHPDKVLYPKVGVTKSDVARYYEQIEKLIIAELKNRPVSLVRSPHGLRGESFYQKHPGESFPSYIERVRITEKSGEKGVYITIDALNDIIYLVNLGVLEFHTWQAKIDDLEHPDRMIFDLDPGSGKKWEHIVEGALLIKEELDKAGYESSPKTSGIKGLHIVVPLNKKMSWDEVKDFTKDIGELLASRHPDKFTVELPKAKRRGRVFVDYLRNSRGATNVAAYSTRAYPTASISMPVKWGDVTTKLKPAQFTIQNFSPV